MASFKPAQLHSERKPTIAKKPIIYIASNNNSAVYIKVITLQLILN